MVSVFKRLRCRLSEKGRTIYTQSPPDRLGWIEREAGNGHEWVVRWDRTSHSQYVGKPNIEVLNSYGDDAAQANKDLQRMIKEFPNVNQIRVKVGYAVAGFHRVVP